MNLDQIRTFLEVADTGNFHRAAQNLNVTQSTVSARIRGLEDEVGRPLFARGRSGVDLTAAGHQFRRYALNMQRLWRRAQQDIALPKGYRGRLGLGSQVSLWDRLILRWIPWMREQAPDVALRVEADYSPSLMRQVADGVLDIAVLYQPRRTPGLVIDELLDEHLVMVSTRPDVSSTDWRRDYVLVDWGRQFRIRHAELVPEALTPPVAVGLGSLGLRYILDNGGSGYFPIRVVRPHLAEGTLTRVPEAPTMTRAAYVVYDENPADPELVHLALDGLREVVREGQWEDQTHRGD